MLSFKGRVYKYADVLYTMYKNIHTVYNKNQKAYITQNWFSKLVYQFFGVPSLDSPREFIKINVLILSRPTELEP